MPIGAAEGQRVGVMTVALLRSADVDVAAVAWRIRRLRRDRRWTQVDLAAECGVQRFTVTRWETSWMLPDALHLCRLADAFGVTTDHLLGRAP